VCKVTNYVEVSCFKECNEIVLSVYRHFGKWAILRVYRDVDTGKVYVGLTQHDVSQTERQLCPALWYVAINVWNRYVKYLDLKHNTVSW
jgi:hypothetical protein